MKSAIAIPLLGIITSLVACDPGISIRAVPQKKSSSAAQDLVIDVAPVNEFTGSTAYIAKAKITNSSNSIVVVTSCELVTERNTYQARLGGVESYPIKLAPGKSELGCGFFDLHDPVHKIFKNPAELRIHYSIAGREEIARVTIASK